MHEVKVANPQDFPGGAGAGGLTDAQLRATPVPVTMTGSPTGGLTDTELRATPVPVSGTVAVTNAGLTELAAAINGSSQMDVNVAASVAIPVTDNAGSLTVDGTVTANLAAGTNNIGDVDVLSLPAIPAGNNNIGDVDIASSVLPTGAATSANQTTIIGHVDGIEGILTTMDADTSIVAANMVAHDAADAGNPIKIGFKAETSPKGITLVADGDRTDAYADADGIQITKIGTSNADITSERVADTAGTSAAFTNFGAVASTRNYITAIHVFRTDAGATPAFVDFRDGTAGAVLWTMALPPNGGSAITSAIPLFKTTANTALAYDVSAALTTVYINVSGFQSKA